MVYLRGDVAFLFPDFEVEFVADFEVFEVIAFLDVGIVEEVCPHGGVVFFDVDLEHDVDAGLTGESAEGVDFVHAVMHLVGV